MSLKTEWVNKTNSLQPAITFINSTSDKQGQIKFTIATDKILNNSLLIQAENQPGSRTGEEKSTLIKTIDIMTLKVAEKVEFTIDKGTTEKNYQLLADNQESVRVMLTATQENGSPLENAKINWVVTGVGSIITASSTKTTNEKGKAWADFKSNGVAGFLNVSAEVSTVPHRTASAYKLDQSIEFQNYELSDNSADMILGTNDAVERTLTLSVISKDPGFSTSNRLISNKRFAFDWVSANNTPPPFSFPNGSTSDKSGKIKIRFSSRTVVNGELTLRLLDPGAVNNLDKQKHKVKIIDYTPHSL